MSGKYLRKRISGRPMDPTMTYVDDPQVFRVGDYIQDDWELHQIVKIDDNKFNNPDIRFVYIIDVSSDDLIHGATVHDVRIHERRGQSEYQRTGIRYISHNE